MPSAERSTRAADDSSRSSLDPATPTPHLANGEHHPLRAVCISLHEKVNAFLTEDVETKRLQAVQSQTRASLQIIQEALDNYP